MPEASEPQLELADPLVSIVLVTYNRAGPLAETIRSIQDQSWTKWELLICDDASRDETADVVTEFAALDKRIRYLGTEINLGMPANLNRGLRMASGPYIAIMHDGDIYKSNAIAAWQKALAASPRIGFVFNRYQRLEADGEISEIPCAKYPLVMPGAYFLESVFFRQLFSSPVWGTAMLTKHALDNVGLPDLSYRQVADVDLWMRICERYDVAFVDEPLIILASGKRLPQQWGTTKRHQRILVRRAFRSARMRHYSDDPWNRWAEIARHLAFTVVHEAYYSLAGVRRKILDSRLIGG